MSEKPTSHGFKGINKTLMDDCIRKFLKEVNVSFLDCITVQFNCLNIAMNFLNHIDKDEDFNEYLKGFPVDLKSHISFCSFFSKSVSDEVEKRILSNEKNEVNNDT